MDRQAPFEIKGIELGIYPSSESLRQQLTATYKSSRKTWILGCVVCALVLIGIFCTCALIVTLFMVPIKALTADVAEGNGKRDRTEKRTELNSSTQKVRRRTTTNQKASLVTSS